MPLAQINCKWKCLGILLFCLFLKTVAFCFQITEPCTSNQQDSESKTNSDETNINYVKEKLKNEIKSLSSKDSNSMLRGKDDESLAVLSWTKLAAELKEKTPTFWTILEACSHNPRQMNTNIRKTKDANVPGIVSAACKLIYLHNRDIDAVQRVNSRILLRGGAKKSAFQRFNSTHDCLSYPSTLSRQIVLGQSGRLT